MASNVVVFLKGGKKQTIKTTPTMALIQIVKLVCDKQGYPDVENYGLKHNKTNLDLSLSVRLANLAPGAKLELIRVTLKAHSEVTIALQMDDGGRIIEKFSSTVTLWEILLHFENISKDKSLNLTKRTAPAPQPKKGMWKKLGGKQNSKLFYQQPVCFLLNQEYGTIPLLKSTTLQSVGITSGNVLLRVLFRHTELSLDDVLEEISTPVQSTETNPINENGSGTPAQPTIPTVTSTSKVEPIGETNTQFNSLESTGGGNAQVNSVESTNLGVNSAEETNTKVESNEETNMKVNSVELAEETNMKVESAEETNMMEESAEETNMNVESTEETNIKVISVETGESFAPVEPKSEIPFTQSQGVDEMDIDTKSPDVQDSIVKSPEDHEPIKKINIAQTEQPSGTQTSPETNEDESVKGHFDRDVKVFNPPPENVTLLAEIDLPDSFYELTSSELQYLLAMQSSKRKAEENAGFKTRAIREQEEKARERKYPKTLIRVRFPDSFQIQMTFLSKETVEQLYKFVKGVLRTPQRTFYLYTSPPKKVLTDMSISLYHAELAPASVVNFNWTDKSSDSRHFLSDEYLKLRTDIPHHFVNNSISNIVPEQSSSFNNKNGHTLSETSRQRNEPAQEQRSHARSSSQISSKVPKWLKIGNKNK